MSGLLFLTHQDFTVIKGSRGNILCNQIPSFSLILYIILPSVIIAKI